MKDIFPGDRPRDKATRGIAWAFLALAITGAATSIVENRRLTRENKVSIADRVTLHAENERLTAENQYFAARQVAGYARIEKLEAEVAKLKAER